MMTFKKFLSTALAGTMALSLAVPAFAADVTDISEPTEIEVTGTTQVPAIKLVVPTSAAVVVNPYRLEVESNSTKVSDQIVSAVQYIENQSPVAVKVETKVTGTTEGTAEFSPSEVGETETKNLVNVTFEIIGTKNTTDAVTWTDAKKGVLVKGTEVAVEAITMAKANDSEADATPNVAFHFTGSAAAAPTTPWTADDIVGATIAFTFTAQANPAPTTP